jgi:CheY-like chemotaxis protein
VDDDPTMIHWLEKNFLSADGFDTYSCYSGKEALGIYKSSGPFDAVVTDFQMPGMTGVELIEAIRKIRPDQHVILQTSETKRLVPSSIPQLHKPYPIRLLLRALRLPVQPLLF